MRIEDLPAAATPCVGESIYSWLEATRVQLGVGAPEWRQWCGFSREEPERRTSGEGWGDLPTELGRIERIPASWRIAAEWRGIGCSECAVATSRNPRYPVLVDWLDARTVACAQHRLLLSYQPAEDAMPVDSNAELLAMWRWLEQWRLESLARQDAKLRRDLVLASGRNWGPGFGAIASAELAWVIEGSGWRLPKPQRQYRPLGPARIGSLSPIDRAASLLGAYRAWMALSDPSTQSLPAWPTPAWDWLARRWCRGGDECLGAMLTGVAVASRGGRR
jgi:hypothetical protein